MSGILTAIGLDRRQSERCKSCVLPQMLSSNLVTRNRIKKSLPGRARDIRSRQVRTTSTVRISRSQIRQVGDHRDVVLMPLQRGEPLRQVDLRKPSGFRRIKRLLRKPKTTTKKDHPLRRRAVVVFPPCETLKKRDSNHGTASSHERTACC